MNSFFITVFSFSLLTNVVLVPVHNQVTGYPHCEHSHHSSHSTWITVWPLRRSIIPSSYCALVSNFYYALLINITPFQFPYNIRTHLLTLVTLESHLPSSFSK